MTRHATEPVFRYIDYIRTKTKSSKFFAGYATRREHQYDASLLSQTARVMLDSLGIGGSALKGYGAVRGDMGRSGAMVAFQCDAVRERRLRPKTAMGHFYAI